MAAAICQSQAAFVSFIDAGSQHCTTLVNGQNVETPLANSLFGLSLQDPLRVLVVENIQADTRTAQVNKLAGFPPVGFYASVPLPTAAGEVWGILTVMDARPKTLLAAQLTALQALGEQICAKVDLQQQVEQLQGQAQSLQQANEQLDAYAAMISHDLKAPLQNMTGLIQNLQEHHANLEPTARHLIHLVQDSAQRLLQMVTGVLEYSKVTELTPQLSSSFHLGQMVTEVVDLLSPPDNITINYANNLPQITTSRAALQQIFLNLFSNAIQYNDKSQGIIDVHFKEHPHRYEFTVEDNGRGIPVTHQKRIFRVFQTFRKSRTENVGTGIGLSTVKKLVEKLGGEVEISSEPGVGSKFSFSIQKKLFSVN